MTQIIAAKRVCEMLFHTQLTIRLILGMDRGLTVSTDLGLAGVQAVRHQITQIMNPWYCLDRVRIYWVQVPTVSNEIMLQLFQQAEERRFGLHCRLKGPDVHYLFM